MLTNTECKNAKAKSKPYKLTDSSGLYLYVSPTGSKSWRFKYFYLKKEKILTLGLYPLVSLQEARELRDAAKKELIKGIDPNFTKKQTKQTAILREEITFEKVAEQWHSKTKNALATNTAHNNLHRLKTDIFPAFGNTPIHKLTLQSIVTAIRQIESRGAKELARRTMGLCSQVLRYAMVEGYIQENPLSEIKPRDILEPVIKKHFASIESKDLPGLLKAIHSNEIRIYPVTRLAVDLMLHTFVRTKELIGAQWDEINFEDKIWMIPAERMKGRVEHLVPLSTRSIEIFRKLKELAGNSDFVFPHAFNPSKHMSNNTILGALDLMDYKGRMTGHGFRSLAMSTIKEKLGYRHEVPDLQLAHKPAGKIAQAYDRAKFLDERKVMMQDWADYLCRLAKKS